MNRARRFVIFLGVVLGLSAAVIGQRTPMVRGQAATSPTLDVTGVDLQSFPDALVTVYAVNLDDSLERLSPAITEDRIPRPVTNIERVEVGVESAILIDSSSNIADRGNTGDPRYIEVANAVDRFVQMSLLSAQTDWLAAFAAGQSVDEFRVLAEWDQDHQGVANALRQFQPEGAPVRTPLFNLIKATLDQFEGSPAADNLRRSIVVFSDGFDSLSAVQIDDIVNRAGRNNVRIHTVMIGPEQESRRQNLQRIADNTGGTYRVYDGIDTIEELWHEIAAERGQYRLAYRMTKAKPSEVGVSVTLRNGQTLADAMPFPVVPALPSVIEVVQPVANTVIQRVAAEPDTPLTELEPRTISIQVALSWPDGHPRNLARLEYELGGRTESATGEALADALVFPIDSYAAGNYTLRVYAIDELGLESRSAPISLRVETVIPTPVPPTATPVPPTATSIPAEATATVQAVVVGGATTAGSADDSLPVDEDAATAISLPQPRILFIIPFADLVVAHMPAEQGMGTLLLGQREIELTPLNLAIALFPLFLLLGLAAYLIWQRQRSQQDLLGAYGAPYPTEALTSESTVVEATPYELTEDATEPQVMPDFIAPASLLYEEGGAHLPEKLDIEGGREIRIGRKQTYCDIILDDQRISRLHAAISEKADGGFYIKDEGSSGGTFVNRRKLRVNDEYRLKTGDIINFNTVAYRFVLNEDPRDAGSAAGSDGAGSASPESDRRSV